MKHFRLIAMVAIAALVALSAVGHRAAPIQAQQIPWPAAVFFGAVDLGSAAVLDGQTAGDESVVSAWNERGLWVQDATIVAGTWIMHIDPHSATSVTFSIDGSERSAEPAAVVSGLASEIALDLRTPVLVVSAPEPEAIAPEIDEPAHIEIILTSTAGVSFVAWTSIDTDAASAFSAVQNLDAVWWWDGAHWELFAPNAPGSLSTNFRLTAGDVLFVLSAGPVTLVL